MSHLLSLQQDNVLGWMLWESRRRKSSSVSLCTESACSAALKFLSHGKRSPRISSWRLSCDAQRADRANIWWDLSQPTDVRSWTGWKLWLSGSAVNGNAVATDKRETAGFKPARRTSSLRLSFSLTFVTPKSSIEKIALVAFFMTVEFYSYDLEDVNFSSEVSGCPHFY